MLLTKKMKSLVTVLLFVLFTISANNLFANGENPNFEITKGNDHSFTISFNYSKETDVEITIKDKHSVTLFNSQVKETKQLSKTFDLNNLPDGVYFLEIENDMNIVSQLIEIKNEKLLYNETGRYSINKPSYKVRGKKLYLTGSLTTKEDVEITILNNYGDIVYVEEIKNQINLKKVFNFIEGKPSDYTVSVKYNDREFIL